MAFMLKYSLSSNVGMIPVSSAVSIWRLWVIDQSLEWKVNIHVTTWVVNLFFKSLALANNKLKITTYQLLDFPVMHRHHSGMRWFPTHPQQCLSESGVESQHSCHNVQQSYSDICNTFQMYICYSRYPRFPQFLGDLGNSWFPNRFAIQTHFTLIISHQPWSPGT